MIAKRFTFGQLAVIAWQLRTFTEENEAATEVVGRSVDLRRMSGAQLSKHLAQLGP